MTTRAVGAAALILPGPAAQGSRCGAGGWPVAPAGTLASAPRTRPLAQFPVVDAVLNSHDHYDHLDLPTIRELLKCPAATFVVPIGVGAHLRRWGAPEQRIIERDWDGSARIGDLTIVCTEARHFSGRGLTRNTTQWSSRAVIGPSHRAFFDGDTGYTAAFAETGRRLGPFGRGLMPVHRATSELGFHRGLSRCDGCVPPPRRPGPRCPAMPGQATGPRRPEDPS